MASKNIGARPATSRRKSFAQQNNKPGNAFATLWQAYSGHNDRDVLLETQLEWANFLWAEATPNVRSCDYAPSQRALLADGPCKLASIAIFNDGSAEWHVTSGDSAVPSQATPTNVSSSSPNPHMRTLISAAQGAGASLVVRSTRDFQSHSLLLSNWSRALSWISAARYHGLSDLQSDLLCEVRNTGQLSLSEAIRCRSDPSLRPLIIAAVFRLVQMGRLFSDLHLNPLSLSTVISAVHHEHDSRAQRTI